MENLKFKVLYLGTSVHEKFKLVDSPDGEKIIKSPRYVVLIKSPELGYVLFDTGDSDEWMSKNAPIVNELYPTTEHISLPDALKAEGLTVDDISLILLSHLHYDHVGGLVHFQNKPAGKDVYVSETEAKDVFYTTVVNKDALSHAYTPSLYMGLQGITFKPIDETTQVAPGIKLFVQYCHTKGVLGMVLTLGDGGNIIFTSDSVFTRMTYEIAKPPRGALFVSDKDFLENLDRLKIMEKDLDATMFYGHEDDQARKWSQLGWIDCVDMIKE